MFTMLIFNFFLWYNRGRGSYELYPALQINANLVQPTQ